MANYPEVLAKLHPNLRLLRQREVKYAGNAPFDLLNRLRITNTPSPAI
jgi:hypothetical protein